MSNISYLVAALARRGPRFLLQYFNESLLFDLVHGTNTHLRVPKVQSAGADGERRDGVLYVASFTSVVRRTLEIVRSRLGDDRFRESHFLDLGCGKGKALLVYALEQGRRAIHSATGIEYDPALCDIARRNIVKLRFRDRAPEVHCDSALNTPQYIRGKYLIVYLYNPFGGETLRAVLKAIAPYPHMLIYIDPVERNLLQDFGYTIEASHSGRTHADTWLVAQQRAGE